MADKLGCSLVYVSCISLFISFFVTDICCSALSWRQNVKQKILGGCAFLRISAALFGRAMSLDEDCHPHSILATPSLSLHSRLLLSPR